MAFGLLVVTSIAIVTAILLLFFVMAAIVVTTTLTAWVGLCFNVALTTEKKSNRRGSHMRARFCYLEASEVIIKNYQDINYEVQILKVMLIYDII